MKIKSFFVLFSFVGIFVFNSCSPAPLPSEQTSKAQANETQTEEEIEPTMPHDPFPPKGPATRTKR